MNDSQQLREQMWDLVYGLLEANESQALIARIKSDPQAARLYSEVRLQADLVGYAARVEDRAFVPRGEAAQRPAPASTVRGITPAAGRKPHRAAGRGRAGTWLALGAATALAGLLAVGQFWQRPNERQLAASYIITEVELPRTIPGGLANSLAFHTTNLDGEAQAATLDVAIRASGGRELYRQQVQTDRDGRAAVAVPGSALEPGVRVEVSQVAALSSASQERAAEGEQRADDAGERAAPGKERPDLARSSEAALVAELPVQAEPLLAYMLLEEPLAAGDKPVNASVWAFNAFSGKPAPASASEQVAQNIPGWAVADESGAALASAQQQQQQGVMNGVVSNRNGQIRGDSSSPGKAVAETAAAGPKGADGASQTIPQAGQQLAGGAAIANRQSLGEQRPERAQTADGYAQSQFYLNAPAESRGLAGRGRNSVPANDPINVEIPAEYAGKPLVVAANARGVTVANANIAPNAAQQGAQKKSQTAEELWPTPQAAPPSFGAAVPAETNLGQLADRQIADGQLADKQLADNVQLRLPPEADGPIEVAVLDPASSPPQVVSRNYVYREPSRKLQIDVRELKERFAPGEQVQVTLAVRDEAGRPAADTRLGVRVWNEQVVPQDAEQPLLLADALQEGLPAADYSAAQYQLFSSQVQQLAARSSRERPALDAAELSVDARRLGGELQAGRVDAEADRLAANAKEGATQPERKAIEAKSDGAAAIARDEQGAAPRGVTSAGSTAGEAVAREWYDDLPSAAAADAVSVATNRPTVQAAFDQAASVARSESARVMRVVGGAAVAGAVVLLVLIVVLAIRRMIRSPRDLLPAVAVALASLLLGFSWIGWFPSAEQPVPLAMHTGEPVAATARLPESEAAEVDFGRRSGFVAPFASPRTGQSAGERPLATIALSAREGKDETQARSDPVIAGETLERAIKEAVPEQLAKQRAGSNKREPLDLPQTAGIAGMPGAPSLRGPAGAPAPVEESRLTLRRVQESVADAKNEAEKRLRIAGVLQPQPGGGATAPASLYFNPNLQTNDQGLATIEFTMPPVNSQYRLLVDALGNGRVGSRQDLLTIQGEAAK